MSTMRFKISFKNNTISKIGDSKSGQMSCTESDDEQSASSSSFDSSSGSNSSSSSSLCSSSLSSSSSSPSSGSGANDEQKGHINPRNGALLVQSVPNPNRNGIKYTKLRPFGKVTKDKHVKKSKSNRSAVKYNEELVSDVEIDRFRSIKNETIFKLKWDDRFIVRVLPLYDNGSTIDTAKHTIIKIKKPNPIMPVSSC